MKKSDGANMWMKSVMRPMFSVRRAGLLSRGVSQVEERPFLIQLLLCRLGQAAWPRATMVPIGGLLYRCTSH